MISPDTATFVFRTINLIGTTQRKLCRLQVPFVLKIHAIILASINTYRCAAHIIIPFAILIISNRSEIPIGKGSLQHIITGFILPVAMRCPFHNASIGIFFIMHEHNIPLFSGIKLQCIIAAFNVISEILRVNSCIIENKAGVFDIVIIVRERKLLSARIARYQLLAVITSANFNTVFITFTRNNINNASRCIASI